MVKNFRNSESSSGPVIEKNKFRDWPSSLLQIFCVITAVIFTLSLTALKRSPVNVHNPAITIREPKELNLVLQVGAFRKETNANVFKEKLSALIDKPVIIVTEEGFYKVQLSGFKTIEDIEKIIPALGLIGIKDFWVPPARKDTLISDNTDLQPVITQNPPEEMVVSPAGQAVTDSLAIEEVPAVSDESYALEIGAFRKKNRALKAQQKVISKLNLPVEIVNQWNRDHVIITGFNNKTEINKFIPELARMGYTEISVMKNNTKLK